MTEEVKFEVGDKVEFTGFAYLYDGLNARETYAISKVYDDGYVSFAEDKRMPPWQIKPEYIKLVSRKEEKERG
jgi:hypothetical protein